MRKRLGIMCSGNGTNFENIVTNQLCKHHEVVLMVYNTKKCGAVKRATKYGIPHVRVRHKNEDEMIKLFEVYNVDLIILAGYMRVLKNPSAFPCPIINVHPSLLPKYKGLHAVEQAMESGDKITGCTVHYVNEKLDEGKIILKKFFFIKKKDTISSLKTKTHNLEYRAYSEAIYKTLSGL